MSMYYWGAILLNLDAAVPECPRIKVRKRVERLEKKTAWKLLKRIAKEDCLLKRTEEDEEKSEGDDESD